MNFQKCFANITILLGAKILIEKEYVIESDSVYEKIVGKSCDTIQFPEIDFAKYSLLGKHTTGKCKVSFNKQVIKNEINKCYNFTLYL